MDNVQDNGRYKNDNGQDIGALSTSHLPAKERAPAAKPGQA